MARILAERVQVNFPLYHGSTRSLKRTVFAAASGRLGEDRQHRVVVQALRDVSFTVHSGQRVALIGSNGAGKTTLLRTLAGIFEPDAGHLRVDGEVHALLDPNLGMNVDLTGRENILLRGLYHGLSDAEIAQVADDVAAFSDLGTFLDLPVRTYSSGMVVRLGFALATSANPQVLLMDEWFLAGDTAFLAKAEARIQGLVQRAEILVLSTHMLEVAEKWCDRAIWLDGGRVRMDGDAQQVIEAYKAA
jgi:lipopolysaccharide transport system ATP-binding protein